MSNPLSRDIRHRFQRLHKEGHCAREIGRRLLISAATAVRYADSPGRAHDLTPAPNPRLRGHGRLFLSKAFFNLRWDSIRNCMEPWRRVTTTLQTPTGQQVVVRQDERPSHEVTTLPCAAKVHFRVHRQRL